MKQTVCHKRFHALVPGILMKLCSDTAARILWRLGGQALLEPRDERRERGELHVRGVVDRRERAGQPSSRRQARAHQAGVGRGSPGIWTATRGTASSRCRRGEPRSLQASCSAASLSCWMDAAKGRFRTVHQCVRHRDNLCVCVSTCTTSLESVRVIHESVRVTHEIREKVS
jgi:hypothetical protein